MITSDAVNTSSPSSLKRLRRKIAATGIAVTSVAGVGLFALLAPSEPDEDDKALSAPDVPRTSGKKILFSDKFRERIGLKWAEVRQAPLTPVVSVIGTVDFDPEHVAAVGTRMRGLVRHVKKFEGDVVRAGDLLAEIDSPELGEAQAAVSMLNAQRAAAERNARREQDLNSRQLSTAREYELAETQLKEYEALLTAARQKVSALGGALVKENSRAPLGIHELRSPLDGTVVERHVFPGQSVEAHLVAFKVANLDRVWVQLAVFERNLPGISLGDPVEIRPLNRPEDVILGRVARIAAQIDQATRSADLRVEIDNSERKLRPGQSVNAEIRLAARAQRMVVLVPSSALTYVDGKPVVFVSEGPNTVTVNEVQLGSTNGQDQQILSGLRAGQRVAKDGVFALKSELFR